MDKRNYKPRYDSSTVIVYFTTRNEGVINKVLNPQKMYATFVSDIGNQFAVEVPNGKEVESIKFLKELDIVNEVNESYLKGERQYFRRKKNFDGRYE